MTHTNFEADDFQNGFTMKALRRDGRTDRTDERTDGRTDGQSLLCNIDGFTMKAQKRDGWTDRQTTTIYNKKSILTFFTPKAFLWI